MLFEAKTLAGKNGIHQCRAGLAQFLEHRLFCGEPENELCLVADRPMSDARVRFLESAGVAIATTDGDRLRNLGVRAVRVLGLQ